MNRRLTKSILLALFAALALLAAACSGAGSSQAAQAPEDTEVSPASEPATAPEEMAVSTETEPAVASAGGAEHDDAADAREEAPAATEASPRDTSKASASGGNGKRTIRIEMTEFSYEPSRIKVKKGETVRFVFTNTGAVEHEALIGDRHLQDEHAAEMLAGDAHHGDGHHGGLSNVRLGPGEKGTLEHTFEDAGKLILGCHIPGHWDAGMKATIDVEA